MALTDRTMAILSFGSDEDLRALGKLTLIFSIVDELLADIAAMLAASVAAGVFSPNAVMNGMKARVHRLEFSRKVRLVRRAIQALTERFELPSTDTGKELMTLLGIVSNLADHRNDLTHGWLLWDHETSRPIFRNKDTKRPAKAEEIEELNRALLQFASDFNKTFVVWSLELKANTETI